MNRYVIRRLLQAVPVLLGITIIIFTFTELAPGDAVTAMIISDPTMMHANIDMDRMRAKYGLDKPAPVRYLKWLGGILRGNLGIRIANRQPVSQEIGLRLPATLQLTIIALLISLLVGVPLGVITAVRQYSWLDYLATAWTFVAISLPGFFAAIAAIYIFSITLDWFPTGGYSTVTGDFGFWDGLLDHAKYMVLPAAVLGIPGIAGIMRYTRSSMLEQIRLDYVTVARAKGLGERAVLFRHALRNALLPVITLVGLRLPGLFGGALIAETIFGWPGMGLLYMDSVTTRDYPMIMGMGLVSAVLIVASNLVTDLAYAVADPRIRYD